MRQPRRTNNPKTTQSRTTITTNHCDDSHEHATQHPMKADTKKENKQDDQDKYTHDQKRRQKTHTRKHPEQHPEPQKHDFHQKPDARKSPEHTCRTKTATTSTTDRTLRMCSQSSTFTQIERMKHSDVFLANGLFPATSRIVCSCMHTTWFSAVRELKS